MIQHKRLRQTLRFLSALLTTIGFAFLGGIVGIFCGHVLFFYFIPPWEYEEINRGGHIFSEFVAADINYSSELFDAELILKTVDGEFFSYYQNSWQQIEPSEIESPRFSYKPGPCNELYSPPLLFYFQRVKNSIGISVGHSETWSSNDRCFLLRADDRLYLWARDHSAFDLVVIVSAEMSAGFLVWGIIGGFIARRRLGLQTPG